MKKLISGLVLAALASSPVFAAESSMSLTSGTSTTVPNTSAGCLILASSVQVGLSQNVQGAVYCRQADGSAPSTILVGTCHLGGLTKSRDVTCTRTLKDGSTTEYNYAPTICTDANFPTTGATTVTVTGPSMFSGNTSTGGGIAENNMDETCSGANVLSDILDIAANL